MKVYIGMVCEQYESWEIVCVKSTKSAAQSFVDEKAEELRKSAILEVKYYTKVQSWEVYDG